jgi:hypothetical protein
MVSSDDGKLLIRREALSAILGKRKKSVLILGKKNH